MAFTGAQGRANLAFLILAYGAYESEGDKSLGSRSEGIVLILAYELCFRKIPLELALSNEHDDI